MTVNIINLGLWNRVEKLIEAGGEPSEVAKQAIILVQNYEKDRKKEKS